MSQSELRAELKRLLPFQTEVMVCRGSDIVGLVSQDPFVDQPASPKITRFVSVLGRRGREVAPLILPEKGKWFLKVLEVRGCFVLGVYRREMKAIRYLGQLDKLFGAQATTRNWNTIQSIAKLLRRETEL